MVVICVAGAGIYFAAQAAMRAPQMQWLTGALASRWRRLTGRPRAPRRARRPGCRAAISVG